MNQYLTKQLQNETMLLRNMLSRDLNNSTVFLMPHSSADLTSETLIDLVLRELEAFFKVELRKYKPEDLFSTKHLFMSTEINVVGYFINNVCGEAVKEVLQLFFRRQLSFRDHNKAKIRLANYGILLPMRCDIKCYSFAHGKGHYYRYRLALHKIGAVPESLRVFLANLPSHCPNDLFMAGPRASSFEINIRVEPEHMKEHACIDFANIALKLRRFKSAHEDVEKYMLESDSASIAAEVPIWLEYGEMNQFRWMRRDDGCLTGHIDVLRYEDGMVEIWDFKPSAADENDARAQVFLYALMLSVRTGIPLESFLCGYFDNKDAFVFPACEVSNL